MAELFDQFYLFSRSKLLFISDHFCSLKIVKQYLLLYSWRFSRCSAPIHWLVNGHMTSNNETVSRQMPWAGNIAKTMTSNGKQFTVTREMLTAVARDRWNLSEVFKFYVCFVLLYNKSLNDWSLGGQWILFPSGPVIKCFSDVYASAPSFARPPSRLGLVNNVAQSSVTLCTKRVLLRSVMLHRAKMLYLPAYATYKVLTTFLSISYSSSSLKYTLPYLDTI